MNILDLNSVPINQVNLQQTESIDSQIIGIRVPCEAGRFLTADDVVDARVLVRPTGVGSYQDIATTPIDLTPYAGTNKDFDLKVHTGAITGFVQEALGVRVTYNP